MIETNTSGTESWVTLEISDRRLPARMVAGRIRADLRRAAPVPRTTRYRRASLVTLTLMALLAPLLGASRIRHSA
jgi:hypothetical protein